MIRIDKQETLPEVPGVTIWGDHENYWTYYALPEQPRLRLNDDGTPVFKFIKYKLPVDTGRPDGLKGGGYAIFDTELTVAEEKMKKLKAVLQDRVNKYHSANRFPGRAPEVKFGTFIFSKGTVDLMVIDGAQKLVEKVRSAGKPSMYGRNVASFAVELSQFGSTIFEQAMQGQGAAAVSVAYNLFFWVKLPRLYAKVEFHAKQFYQFYQQIDFSDGGPYGDDTYKEKVREMWKTSESTQKTLKLDFTLPNAELDMKIKDGIRAWLDRAEEDIVSKVLKDTIPGVAEDKRKALGGIEHLVRDIKVEKLQDFTKEYSEDSVIDWNLLPQGNLGAITALKDRAGKPILWKDYSMYIDADDPFFKTVDVLVRVNADFQRLPIASIKVTLEYPKSGGKKEIKTFVFTDAAKSELFSTYMENDNWKYKYWYEVSYKGQSRTFKSPVLESEEEVCEVNVDDSGILLADLIAGDLDFDQSLRAAQVTVQYEDRANGVSPIEKQFIIDKDHQQQVFSPQFIFQPQRNPYRFRTKFMMKTGKEFYSDWTPAWSSPLVINDTFSDMKTVGIRASGDLQNKIDTIFLDLTYTDLANKYSQRKSVVLNEENPFFDWFFPVVSETGKLFYAGTIKYKDGTEEEIKETEAAKDTILVGPKISGFVRVEVLPDLLDWSLIKLAKISLQYIDAANGINAKKDVIFRSGATDSQIWEVELKDKNKIDYQWQGTFYMTDGAQKKTDMVTTSEPTLIPEVPL